MFPFVTVITSEMVVGPESPLISFRDIAKNEVEGFWSDLGDSDSTNPLKTQALSAGFVDIMYDMTVGLLTDIGGVFQRLLGTALSVVFFIPLSVVGVAFLVGYLMPALNFLILVQSVRFLSLYLGEEVDINTLTKLM